MFIVMQPCFHDDFLCHVVAVIEVEQFRIDSHCHAASFSQKLYLCETNNIFHSRDITFDTKITTDSESSSKMNMRSRLMAFGILPTSVFICIQRVLHENETT